MTSPGRRQSVPRDARRIPMPAVAMADWLADIDDLAELRLTLRVAALLAEEPIRRATPPSVAVDDLLDDHVLRRAAGAGNDQTIRGALAAALTRETLAAARIGGEVRLFLYDDRCRQHLKNLKTSPLPASDAAGAAATDVQQPEGSPSAAERPARANIFDLYERHIGSFGHGTAEQLRAAEEEYPPKWIEDAFEIAAEQNVHSWGYVHAILRRWLQTGKPAASSTLVHRQRDYSHDHGEPGHNTAPDSRTGYLESYRRRHGRLPWESPDARDGDG